MLGGLCWLYSMCLCIVMCCVSGMILRSHAFDISYFSSIDIYLCHFGFISQPPTSSALFPIVPLFHHRVWIVCCWCVIDVGEVWYSVVYLVHVAGLWMFV